MTVITKNVLDFPETAPIPFPEVANDITDKKLREEEASKWYMLKHRAPRNEPNHPKPPTFIAKPRKTTDYFLKLS